MLIAGDALVSQRTLALITLMAVSVFGGNASAGAQGGCSQRVVRTSASWADGVASLLRSWLNSPEFATAMPCWTSVRELAR
jgi:hypothetical protein